MATKTALTGLCWFCWKETPEGVESMARLQDGSPARITGLVRQPSNQRHATRPRSPPRRRVWENGAFGSGPCPPNRNGLGGENTILPSPVWSVLLRSMSSRPLPSSHRSMSDQTRATASERRRPQSRRTSTRAMSTTPRRAARPGLSMPRRSRSLGDRAVARMASTAVIQQRRSLNGRPPVLAGQTGHGQTHHLGLGGRVRSRGAVGGSDGRHRLPDRGDPNSPPHQGREVFGDVRRCSRQPGDVGIAGPGHETDATAPSRPFGSHPTGWPRWHRRRPGRGPPVPAAG